MKILVTGAAGFLGFHLAKRLAATPDNQIVCVDNGIRGEFDEHYQALTEQPNVEHYALDLNDQAAVETLPADVELIHHMAALNGTQNFYERPFEVVRCCSLPTLNLLQKYGGQNGLRRFVYAGSSESYASIVSRFGWPVPTAEDVPLGIDDVFNTRWSYGVGKTLGEVAVIAACDQFGMAQTILRYHNIYGPRMGDKHVVPDFYTRAKDGVLALYGYQDTRSFLYIDDAVDATIRAGTADSTSEKLVNVGSADEVTIRELGETMKNVAGLSGEIALHPSPAGSVKRRCPDVSKLHQLTGFEQKWSLEAGLSRTADFYLRGIMPDPA